MAQIILQGGQLCTVDDIDFPILNQGKWYLNVHGYAASTRGGSLMHRFINKTPKGFHTDHIDGNKLNNRRDNLRTALAHQNGANSRVSKNSPSGFTGVAIRPDTGKWRARIMVHRKEIGLGCFDTQEEAVLARRQAEKEYFGEFAPTRIL